MLMSHTPLMRSDQPSLHQSRHPVAQGQEIVPNGAILTRYLTSVAEPLQPVVSIPIIRPDYAARLHGSSDRRFQTLGRGVLDPFKPDSANTLPILLCRNKYQRLSCRSTTPLSRLRTTDIGLVNLHCTRKTIPPRPDHSPPQLVQPRPGRFIAAQPQNSLHSFRTGTILLTGHPPDGPKPQYKRFSRPFKDRPGNDGGLVVTVGTLYQSVYRGPALPVPATRASESIRPTQFGQILPAGLLRRKPLFQLRKILGVILHALRDYILCLPQSRGYPHRRNRLDH